MAHQFLDTALRLISNGYRIVPIKAGTKRPGVKDWEKAQATEAQARKWAADGFADGNVGIITENTPAIDIDVYDADIAAKLEAWCIERFGGDMLIRVGQAPKRLLVFQASQPFTKMFAQYADPSGKKHKVEILGNGQQFVAYGIHPDTHKPFQWTTMDEPLDTPADLLPMLTRDMAVEVLEAFGTFAKAAGWKYLGSSDGRQVAVAEEADDNALMTHKARLKLTMAEITHALDFVDMESDYDRWVMVGMALHHQSQGKPGGLEVWKEWSSRADNYSAKACEDKWDSFHDNSGRRTPVTMASVLKIANEREKIVKGEEFTRALNRLRTASDEDEITTVIAKELVHAATNEFQFDMIAKKMQDRLFEITEVRPRIETVRKMLSKARGREEVMESGARPKWCHGWVYLKNADKFYHVETKRELTERGFNAVYDRYMLSDDDKMVGNAVPAARASQAALNLYDMVMVDQKVYLPGMDNVLEVNGRMCVNTFDQTTIPEEKAPESHEEKAAIETIEKHFRILLPDEFERNLILDYLAYNVQFPAEKISWAIVMQGVEGAGKTTIMKLMSRVLGPQNVGPVSATELQDKYTGWAENKKLNFIEEIRLHGQNRYEILDKLKPFISNEDANVRRMNRDSYEIPNVTNYFMFTNYWDGLPLSSMDRRYYVVATWFQTKAQLKKFQDQNPNYFEKLYGTIREYGEVLRWWMLNRQIGDAFQPKKPALDSTAKLKMRDISEHSEESDAINDVLETSTDPEISDKLLNSDKLKSLLEFEGVSVPYGKGLATLLSKHGFVLIGRFRMSSSAAPIRFYTREPDLFPKGEELAAIRAIRESVTTDELDPFA